MVGLPIGIRLDLIITNAQYMRDYSCCNIAIAKKMIRYNDSLKCSVSPWLYKLLIKCSQIDSFCHLCHFNLQNIM